MEVAAQGVDGVNIQVISATARHAAQETNAHAGARQLLEAQDTVSNASLQYSCALTCITHALTHIRVCSKVHQRLGMTTWHATKLLLLLTSCSRCGCRCNSQVQVGMLLHCIILHWTTCAEFHRAKCEPWAVQAYIKRTCRLLCSHCVLTIFFCACRSNSTLPPCTETTQSC